MTILKAEYLPIILAIVQTFFTITGPLTTFFQDKKQQKLNSENYGNNSVIHSNYFENSSVNVNQTFNILSFDNIDNTTYTKNTINLRLTLKRMYDFSLLLIFIVFLVILVSGIKNNNLGFKATYLSPITNYFILWITYTNYIILVLSLLFTISYLFKKQYKMSSAMFVSSLVATINIFFLKTLNIDLIVRAFNNIFKSEHDFYKFLGIITVIILIFLSFFLFYALIDILFGVRQSNIQPFKFLFVFEVNSKNYYYFIPIGLFISYIIYFLCFHIFSNSITGLLSQFPNILQDILKSIFHDLTKPLQNP
ncbi:hypothetical protein [Macrococcus armenti]|uniref:hypothetical protein n=1 Tax=Macrococcus armenti TaxID=2875764 RepID=UPI001CCF6988|nr:hypothetical protein [Macrococcus armenti]UBH16626.1 hypothetical protein LAU44_11990 [Macrococcus armenti]UBH21260.1 hypothetical protein LAU40_12025 [Macrococcus armenti]